MTEHHRFFNMAKYFFLGERIIIGGEVWPIGHSDYPKGHHKLVYIRLPPKWKRLLNKIPITSISLEHDGISIWLSTQTGRIFWWAAFWWKPYSGSGPSYYPNRLDWRAGKANF